MIFTDTFTVTAGKAATAPLERTVKLPHGIIHLVEISFLDGPENEVHIALRRAGLHQFCPTDTGSIVGNARTVSVVLREPVEEDPLEVVIEAWAPDATYDHEISVGIHVLRREVLEGAREELGILKRLSRAVLGRA